MNFIENNRKFEVTFSESIQVGVGGSGVAISDMSYLFYYNARMKDYDNVIRACKDITKASYCFAYSGIETFDSATFPDTSKCGSFGYMFSNCTDLVKADLSHLDCSSMAQSNGSGFYEMFRNCEALEEVIGFAHKSSDYPNTRETFYKCPRLKRLTFSPDVGDFVQMDLDISDCGFEREGMVELFNSLPIAGQKCLLTIEGNPCVTGRSTTTVPNGEYHDYIEDADTLIAVLNENVLSDEADCIIEDATGDMRSYMKEIMIRRANDFIYPVKLEWLEHTVEAKTEKLTDNDRMIAENKGWSLIG